MTLPISLVVAHFVGDFILQSDWMAIQKSKRWDALTLHVLLYSLCFLPWGLHFFLLTYLTHFITDAITYRVTSKLWFVELIPTMRPYRSPSRNSVSLHYDMMFPFDARVLPTRHWFFVMIGFDQLVHMVTLSWTLQLLK